MWRDGEGKRASAEITPFRGFGTEYDKAAEHVTTRALGEGPVPLRISQVQEFGTIEARS
jgi:hypothetical protein